MGTRSDYLTIGGTPLAFAMPCGVKLTALGLDDGGGAERLWVGLPLLVAGVVGVECLRRCVESVAAEPARLGIRSDKARSVLRDVRALQAAALVLLPVAAALQFALLLDGHVHLRACGWLFLVYGIGAVAVCVVRRASTRWGSCYLRWGWAPMVGFGVPLGLPSLMATGLVTPAVPPG